MNIVIPMGGIGERFARVGYRCARSPTLRTPKRARSFPKPLVNLVGRPMIFWLLDNLDLTPDDRVYSASAAAPCMFLCTHRLAVAVNDHIDQEFAICSRIGTEYSSRPWKLHFVPLNFQARGRCRDPPARSLRHRLAAPQRQSTSFCRA